MIALITDFGSRDYFIGVVKGVIRKKHPGADMVDICHDVEPFSIVNAQYILSASYRYFPAGTLFYVVVDPGVGSDRRAIIARDREYTFVIPDNGIISAAATDGMEFYAIREDAFPSPSHTFHGRDIFAPAAAHLDRGDPLDDIASPAEDIVEKPFPRYMAGDSLFEGDVFHVDRFGNIITSVPADVALAGNRQTFTLDTDSGGIPLARVNTYSELDLEETGIIHGSSGFVEIARNQDAASSALNIATGDTVKIFYEKK